MRIETLWRAACLAACVVLPCAAAPASDAVPADALKTIDAVNGKWVAALKSENVKWACEGFAEDALFIADDGTVTRGVTAFAELLRKRFDAGLKVTGGKVTRLGAHWVHGQIIEWGSSILQVADKNGGTHRGGGDYLAVWTKGADGTWKITRNIALGLPPP